MALKVNKKKRNNDNGSVDAVQVSEFKGSPVISLPTGNQYPFTFGLTKAKLIIEYYDDIKAFVKVNKNKSLKKKINDDEDDD
jgi:hypothetical protein